MEKLTVSEYYMSLMQNTPPTTVATLLYVSWIVHKLLMHAFICTTTDWAAMNQQLQAVQYLLDTYPQDVLATNASGRSALTEAFSTSNMNVVNILLQHSSASEERFHETTPPSEGAGDDSEESKGNTELSEGINTENAIEHEFLLSQDKIMRIRELVSLPNT